MANSFKIHFDSNELNLLKNIIFIYQVMKEVIVIHLLIKKSYMILEFQTILSFSISFGMVAVGKV